MNELSEQRSGIKGRWREWRRRHAELALADAEHVLHTWGSHVGTFPSSRDRMERAVARARRRLDRCS